jgi:hypothetical protein
MADEGQVETSIAAVIKSFCEDALRSGVVDFTMSDLLEYVKACVPGTAPDTAGEVLKGMKQRGEINFVLVSRSGSHYRVAQPQQPQTTVFGADSGKETGKRSKAFTKKAKKEAFDALTEMSSMDPRLNRLYEWLYEQALE